MQYKAINQRILQYGCRVHHRLPSRPRPNATSLIATEWNVPFRPSPSPSFFFYLSPGQDPSKPLPINIDNRAAITMANPPGPTARTKHIDHHIYFLIAQVQQKKTSNLTTSQPRCRRPTYSSRSSFAPNPRATSSSSIPAINTQQHLCPLRPNPSLSSSTIHLPLLARSSLFANHANRAAHLARRQPHECKPSSDTHKLPTAPICVASCNIQRRNQVG